MDLVSFYLILSAILFSMGALGVLLRRNTIIVLMCVELMLNAANISFVALASRFGDINAHVYVLFVMAIAAAEVAVGLAIVISVFRHYVSVKSSDPAELRG